MGEIEGWLEAIGYRYDRVTTASSDASLRHYYRVEYGNLTTILMDSRLQKDSIQSFLGMNRRLQNAGVRVPRIIDYDEVVGFVLMEDLGSLHLFDCLNETTYHRYYTQAIDTILTIQTASVEGLPLYDRDFLLFEMGLMEEWYFGRHLVYQLTSEEGESLANLLDTIADKVLTQPQGVVVHRDFHSRNLMMDGDNLCVIDYQDARVGAITYDLVSLLRDCYISFDPHEIARLALIFRDKKGLEVDDDVFLEWFDFMGLQRHIKVLGIFARLSHRDGKHGYLDDIPQVLTYIMEVAHKYPPLAPLMALLQKGVRQ